MCACEPGFVCGLCAGTPADPRYLDDEPEPEPYRPEQQREECDHARRDA